jgi:hypothetical protein
MSTLKNSNPLLSKPHTTEYDSWYQGYVNYIAHDNVDECLQSGVSEFSKLINQMTAKQLENSYAPGKWTPNQMVQHLCDSELLFTYRLMMGLRGSKDEMAGFDPNDCQNRAPYQPTDQLLSHLNSLRGYFIFLRSEIHKENETHTFCADGKTFTLRALVWINAGHVLHHTHILKERYLNP